MNFCQAITLKGTTCQNKTTTEYCYCHLNTQYIHVSGWPSMTVIKSGTKRLKNINEFLPFLRKVLRSFLDNNNNIQNRIVTMICFETFYKNSNFDFTAKIYQHLIKIMCDKLLTVPHLTKYTDTFRRKFQTGYLDGLKTLSKQKYIEHIFTHSNLGPGIAKHIASFV